VPVRSSVFAMDEPHPTFENWEVETILGASSNTWSHSLDDDMFSVDVWMTIPRDVSTKNTLHLDGKAFLAPGFTYRASKYSTNIDTLQIIFDDSSGFHSIPLGPLIHKDSPSEPWRWLSTQERVMIPTDLENLMVQVSITFKELDIDSTFSKQFKIKMKRKDNFKMKVPDWLNH
jgi:hypothetical protein